GADVLAIADVMPVGVEPPTLADGVLDGVRRGGGRSAQGRGAVLAVEPQGRGPPALVPGGRPSRRRHLVKPPPAPRRQSIGFVHGACPAGGAVRQATTAGRTDRFTECLQRCGRKLKEGQDFWKTIRIAFTAGNGARAAKSGGWIRSPICGSSTA